MHAVQGSISLEISLSYNAHYNFVMPTPSFTSFHLSSDSDSWFTEFSGFARIK